MNFKDANKHYIDTLEFINCELTELCRSLYRGEVNGAGEDFSGAGTLKVFRMENCTVHNGFRQYDAMPAIYMAQPVGEMIFKNNTFYDLTYLNSIVSFGNISENAGLQAIKVVFENNTVCAYSRSSLLNFGAGVQSDSEFHIKNNIVLQPNWIDDMNGRQNDNKDIHEVEGETWTKNDVEYECRSLTEEELQERIDKGVVLTGIQGGLVQWRTICSTAINTKTWLTWSMQVTLFPLAMTRTKSLSSARSQWRTCLSLGQISQMSRTISSRLA
jgi:hypothetical protein